jgi:2-polyprenyl-3-methyl-5-hydroxy-6-metoxy-1,4-benzoquinol methylase
MNNIENVNECPWCGSKKSFKWCEDKEPFLTVQCNNCNIVYVKRRLNQKGREEFYKNYNTEIHQQAAEKKLREEMYQLENKFITEFIDKGNVLDVGCGGAFFLDTFDSTNFNKYGVEYGDNGFDIASKKYPGKMYQGEFPSLDNIENNYFDLIIFRGVLEHVVNPKDYLTKASNALKDGGWLFISATPNLNSLCADLFRENFNQHFPDEHIIHFGDHHFKNYLKDIDFQFISERIFYTETPYANLYGDAKLVAKAIELIENNKKIDFKSPPWYGNMMTLLFRKSI